MCWLLSCVQLSAAPQTVARQPPLSMGFSSKNTGVACHSLLQRVFPTQESTLVSCFAGRFFNIWATGKSLIIPLLSTYFVFGTMVGSWETAVNSRDIYFPGAYGLSSGATHRWTGNHSECCDEGSKEECGGTWSGANGASEGLLDERNGKEVEFGRRRVKPENWFL